MEKLELTDPRWAQLRGTYSSGSEVARDLAALATGALPQKDEENLWQELCHQDDSTEAGYAAIPYLVEMAAKVQGDRALLLLAMAGHVFACAAFGSSHRIPDFLRPAIESAVKRARAELGDLLKKSFADSKSNVKALAALVAALFNNAELYVSIQRLDCPVNCPNCGNSFLPHESGDAIRAKSQS